MRNKTKIKYLAVKEMPMSKEIKNEPKSVSHSIFSKFKLIQPLKLYTSKFINHSATSYCTIKSSKLFYKCDFNCFICRPDLSCQL